MFVNYEAIDKKEVFGDFIKFTYYNNFVPCVIYCRSDRDFQKLLIRWNQASRTMGGKYHYTFEGERSEITLRDIPADNKHKIKSLLTCSLTGVTYIM